MAEFLIQQIILICSPWMRLQSPNTPSNADRQKCNAQQWWRRSYSSHELLLCYKHSTMYLTSFITFNLQQHNPMKFTNVCITHSFVYLTLIECLPQGTCEAKVTKTKCPLLTTRNAIADWHYGRRLYKLIWEYAWQILGLEWRK